jgi:predicted dienelactone hydrolase
MIDMRPLEVTLIALLLVWAAVAAVSLTKKRRVWPWPIFLPLCVIAAGHVIVEGWRLQMAPAYVALLLVALSSFNLSSLVVCLALCGGVMLCALFSLAGAYAYPVFTLPKPQGAYAIGTFVAHMVDRGRHERHSDNPNAHREFMVQVWYPAQHQNNEKRAWYRDPRINSWRSNHLRLVKTHSFWNLPVAQQPQTFPVLLFSPSSGGNRDQNTFEVEELASQGYVVVGLDHPYSSSRVAFPDGRIVYSAPWLDTASRAAYNASVINVEVMVQDQVGDARFALDQMERWNLPGSGQLLSGRLNLSRIGVFGHSFGGALAGALCLADPRVVAGINMDGWMFGDAETKGIPRPFFFMGGGYGEALDPAVVAKRSGSFLIEGEKDLAYERGRANSLRQFGGYRLTILGADHGNYSDLALFTRPLPFLGRQPMDPYRAFQIVDAYTLAFFDRYVRQRPAPLLDRDAFPGEVRFEVYRASALGRS